MKRFVIATLVAVALSLVVSCGGGTTTEVKKDNTPVVENNKPLINYQIIRQSETPTPTWVNKKWEVVKEDAASGLPKMIYLVVEGSGNDQERARISADAAHVAKLTELFKAVATREFAVAKQGMLNDAAPLDAYYEETIAVLSKNVDISGIPSVGEYWEYIAQQEGTGPVQKSYRYIIRYGMDFSLYQKAITRSVQDAAKKVNPELQNKAQNTLSALNASVDKMDGQSE